MPVRLRLLAKSVLTLAAALITASAAAADAAEPAAHLLGRWQLNRAASDDAEKLLAERIERIRAERARWLERQRRTEPRDVPDEENETPPPPPPDRYARRREQEERVHRMLGFTDTLALSAPRANAIDIRSDMESRRVEPGARSQVSLPEGELADSTVTASPGGDLLEITRRVRRGPSVHEKFRWLKKTDQLEYTIAWSGNTWLQRMKIRRVFDRATTAPPPPANPDLGPVP